MPKIRMPYPPPPDTPTGKMPQEVRQFIKNVLKEDIGGGDVTSEILVPEDSHSTARLIAKERFVLAGMPFAWEVFRSVDRKVVIRPFFEEGSWVKKPDAIATVEGPTRSLLAAERVALNILQRLSGIATLTAAFAGRVEGYKARILDTRKTAPGMRYMEKYAVRTGGGHNHRFGLYDAVLIKDNHIKSAGGLGKAVRRAKKAAGGMTVEVEATTLDEVAEAIKAKADVIMLDNMTITEIKEAVRFVAGRAVIEVSGNVSLKNVREIAATGVDFISVGSLTHSAHAADISMLID